MSTSNVISVLEKNSTSEFFIEHTGSRSNHLAHGVIALHRLGAPVSRLEQFVKWYTPVLESVESDAIDDRPVEELRGERVSYYRILEHFKELLKTKYKSLDELIREEYPKLCVGLAGALLHGTIHVGYGYSVGSERIAMEGLAYVYHSYIPVISTLPAPELDQFGNGKKDILTVLAEVKDNKALKESVETGIQKEEYVKLKHGNFQTRVCYLLTEHGDELLKYVLGIKVDENLRSASGNIDAMKLSRRMVFWATLACAANENKNDFYLLHGSTCAWSLYQITSVMKAEDAIHALRDYVTVLLAVYIADDAPALTTAIKPTCEPTDDNWKALVDEAMSKDLDEHQFKLLQVCKEMAKDAVEYGEDPNVYLQAAEDTVRCDLYFRNWL